MKLIVDESKSGTMKYKYKEEMLELKCPIKAIGMPLVSFIIEKGTVFLYRYK